MDLIKAIGLGILQGLSEFLPISSSGHLVIAEHFMKFNQGGLAFEVFVHFGTLIAVVWVFRKEIRQMLISLPDIFRINDPAISPEKKQSVRLVIYILIGSIPAAVVGLGFEDSIEKLFESHVLAMGMLFITGVVVWSSRYTRQSKNTLSGFRAFLIGIAQAVAILPGISRSGSTIVTGLWLGLPRQMVARFSFLLSIPVILGATVLKIKEVLITPLPEGVMLSILLASLAATISGYFAIVWLLAVIQKKKFEWFGIYCMLVSLIGLAIDFLFP